MNIRIPGLVVLLSLTFLLASAKAPANPVQTKSFADIPWEKKCEGVVDFVREYAKVHLDKVQVTPEPGECRGYQEVGVGVVFLSKFTLSKDNFRQEFRAFIPGTFDYANGYLTIRNPSLMPAATEAMASHLGVNITKLREAFVEWVNKNPKQEVTVFGLPFSQYASRFETKYGIHSSGVKIFDGAVTLQVIPDSVSHGQGTVRFVNVEKSIFASPFLGCSDAKCLASRTIRYHLLGSDILLVGRNPAPDNTNYVSFFQFKSLEW